VYPDQRIVVDVDHPGVLIDGLGDLVHVLLGGQTRADVEELPDARLLSEPAHRLDEQPPVGLRPYPDLRHPLEDLFGRLAVGGVVVLAAQEVVVHAGDVRLLDVDAGRRRPLVHVLRRPRRDPILPARSGT